MTPTGKKNSLYLGLKSIAYYYKAVNIMATAFVDKLRSFTVSIIPCKAKKV